MHGTDFQDSLGDFFSPPVLPPEYGGEGPGIEEACQDWTNKLFQSETILQQIASHPTGDIAVTPEDPLISEGSETEQISEEWCLDLWMFYGNCRRCWLVLVFEFTLAWHF